MPLSPQQQAQTPAATQWNKRKTEKNRRLALVRDLASGAVRPFAGGLRNPTVGHLRGRCCREHAQCCSDVNESPSHHASWDVPALGAGRLLAPDDRHRGLCRSCPRPFAKLSTRT